LILFTRKQALILFNKQLYKGVPMNKICKDMASHIRFSTLVSITAMSVLFGCKKEEVPPEAQQQQAVTDMSAVKADIIVHSGGSIQAAVNAASAGMVIKIEPGIYKESVSIKKARIKLIGLTIKGAGVIIQNPGNKEDGITVDDDGDGFTLQNVTVRGFEENGVILNGVSNFCISYVTAIDNGEYGIFPVHSSHGIIDHCTVSGHSDTGLYVGQSSDVKMQFNTAFANVNGLEVENSSDIKVTCNQSHNNVCGMLIDLLPGKDIKTSHRVYVGDNHVYNNNHKNFGEKGELESYVPTGLGILVLGTDETTVEKNTVTGNKFSGIVVFSTLVLGSLAGLPPEAFADIEPNPDGAYIHKNILRNNGAAPPEDLGLPGVDLLWDGSGINNCWSGNLFKTNFPSPLPSCN
jgi:parallel beta-helix repeat protein